MWHRESTDRSRALHSEALKHRKHQKRGGVLFQMLTFVHSIPQLIHAKSLDESLRSLIRFKEDASALARFSNALFGTPIQRRSSPLAKISTGFWKRQWLLIILCGTVVVPIAFYVASLLEGVAYVEYTGLAAPSWPYFFAGAVLNGLKK